MNYFIIFKNIFIFYCSYYVSTSSLLLGGGGATSPTSEHLTTLLTCLPTLISWSASAQARKLLICSQAKS